MIQCIPDGKKIQDRRELHAALAAGLGLPKWYGGTLDGLYDCLTEPVDRALTVINWGELAQNLGPYANRLWRVLTDAAGENPCFFLKREPSPEPASETK